MTPSQEEVLRLLCEAVLEIDNGCTVAAGAKDKLRAFAEKPAISPETELDFEVRLANLEKRMRQRQELTRRVEALERHIASHAQGATKHPQEEVASATCTCSDEQIAIQCQGELDSRIEGANICGICHKPKPATVEEIAEEIRRVIQKEHDDVAKMPGGCPWKCAAHYAMAGARVALRMKEEGRL